MAADDLVQGATPEGRVKMCGICGSSPALGKTVTRRMCDMLQHRGPDSEGYFDDTGVSLGVRRLRIIDLLTGDQPIHNEEGTVWVVYNGEIYNYGELRKELESLGHSFYTETDTEVLVHGYESFGVDFVRELRGMFAFAIWDARNKSLVIARDRFGKKPLYYGIFNGNFMFASELRPLMSVGIVPPVINLKAVAHYLAYFYNPLDESFIQEVFRLPPAHYLVWQPSTKKLIIETYWDLETDRETEVITPEEAVDVLGRVLKEATSIRMRSDVPLGILLSGGVDSSVITGLASSLKKRLQTYTVVHGGRDSEGPYARQVSELFGTDHREYFVDSDALGLLPEIASRLDEPFGDSSIIPTYIVSREVRKHVTVCLTGDGGDEMFWGYPWLSTKNQIDRWFAIPSPLRRPLRAILADLPTKRSSEFRDLKRYEDLGYGKSDGRTQCLMRLSHFSPETVDRVVGNEFHVYDTYREVINRSADLQEAKAYLTIKKVLPNDFLYKVDRGSMLNSLEVRSPLLDHILAETTWKWPSNLKNGNGEAKNILKRYAVQRLGIPKSVVYRHKGGFSIPASEWFGEARNMLLASSNKLNKIVSGEILRGIAKERPSYEQSSRVLALLILSLWLEGNSF